MRKCLIILMGLLATSAFADSKCERGFFGDCVDPETPYKSYPEYQQQEQAERQRKEDSQKWEPVIVNGPNGARMYYPNGDGTFYQTYDR